MKHIFNDILTVRNGIDVDNTKLYIFVGIVFFLALSCYGIYADSAHHFNAIEFGTGFGGLVSLGSVGTAVKAHTEPSDEPKREDK